MCALNSDLMGTHQTFLSTMSHRMHQMALLELSRLPLSQMMNTILLMYTLVWTARYIKWKSAKRWACSAMASDTISPKMTLAGALVVSYISMWKFWTLAVTMLLPRQQHVTQWYLLGKQVKSSLMLDNKTVSNTLSHQMCLTFSYLQISMSEKLRFILEVKKFHLDPLIKMKYT